jgi:putative drug exporter of the RND superfamily
MFQRLGHAIYRHRRLVLVSSLVAAALCAIAAAFVLPRLGSQGFDDPGSDSAAAAAIMDRDFDAPEADLVIALDFDGPADGAAESRVGRALTDTVAGIPGVLRVGSYWRTAVPSLASTDGTGALILVTFDPAGRESPRAITDAVQEAVTEAGLGTATAYVGGGQSVAKAINVQVARDLARAESIAIPATLVLLVVVFGSLVAAGMPMLVGVGAIVASLLVLFLITFVTDVSVFAVNLVTGLGLGLGIDYALLVVSRFREELTQRETVEDAVARTVATAGRTVVFSGLTVGVTLASMALFPLSFLRSFAYAGTSVVLFAVLGALVTLPAALAMLGPRINSLRIRRNVGRAHEGRRWAVLATWIMRHPWPVAIASAALLLVLAWPALSVRFSQLDERALPPSDPAVVATNLLRSDYPDLGGAPIEVIVPAAVGEAAIADYATAISSLDTIEQVAASTGVYRDGARVADPQPTVVTSAGAFERIVASTTERPRSPEGEAVIAAVRAVPAPDPLVVVGGLAAEYTDSQQAIARTMPWVLAWILGSVLVLLFLFTGSVLLPVKAIVMNVMSLAAAMGVLVWVFQEGHLTWLVGDFTNTGTLDTATLVITAIVAFGLSMDYEVFLLSRIKEEYDRTGDNTAAVAYGLQRSAGIITAAALLLAVVFVVFLTSTLTNIKIMGLGITVAILIDATIVRIFLVPAFMRIAGGANWWAPAPLRAVYRRFGIVEG